MSFTNRLKTFALAEGADLVGIATVNRFDRAPPGHKPTDILLDAKTVVVLAKRIPQSVVRAR